jgi:hypothetical protein
MLSGLIVLVLARQGAHHAGTAERAEQPGGARDLVPIAGGCILARRTGKPLQIAVDSVPGTTGTGSLDVRLSPSSSAKADMPGGRRRAKKRHF